MDARRTQIAAGLTGLAVAAVAAVAGVAAITDLQTFLCLTFLQVVATLLRTEAGRLRISFDSVVAVPAIILLQPATTATASILIGSLAGAAILIGSNRRLFPRLLCETSWNALATISAAAFLSSALTGARGIEAVIVAAVVFHLARMIFEALDAMLHAGDSARQFRFDTRTALLCLPLVALEVLLFREYGPSGLAAAFLPLFVLAHVVRREAAAHATAQAAARRASEVTLLEQSAVDFMTAEDDSQTFARLEKALNQLAPRKACAIVTWYSDEEQPRVHRYGDCRPDDAAIARWIGDAGLDLATPRELLLYEREQRTFPLSGESTRQVVCGLQTVEVVYGILIYESDDSIDDPRVRELFRTFIDQAAAAIQSQMLRRRFSTLNRALEQQHARVHALADVARTLIEDRDAAAMLTRLAESIQKTVGFSRAVFWALDEKLGDFVPAACAGFGCDELAGRKTRRVELEDWMRDEFRVANAFFVSKNRIVDADSYRSDEHRPEWHPSDRLILPLTDGELLLGFLSVDAPEDDRVPTLETLQVLELYQNQAVSAIRSVRQHEQIQRLTIVDSLTAAYNHRHFQDALRKEIQRHERTHHEFALAMLDIDNFKTVNDQHGHTSGDEILRQLVERLLLNVREIDVVARYGGEEFAIIFPELPRERTREVGQRIRDAIASEPFTISRNPFEIRVTVSIGVSSFPGDGFTSIAMIESADHALYRAKRAGKNRVELAWSGSGVAEKSL